jgi:hypothetical protein
MPCPRVPCSTLDPSCVERRLITYDELRTVVRKQLKLKRAEVSDDMLKSLWVALDVDNSDNLAFVEFSKFVQRAHKDENGKTSRTTSKKNAKLNETLPLSEPVRGRAKPLPPRPGSTPTPRPLTTNQRYQKSLQQWPTTTYYELRERKPGYSYLPDPFYNRACLLPGSTSFE